MEEQNYTILNELDPVERVNDTDLLYIKGDNDNKVTASQVNDYIESKADTVPTDNSTRLVTSGGVKSALNEINDKIPLQATAENQLADKDFVNSSVQTNTASFFGNFPTYADFENAQGSGETHNDYAVVRSDETHNNECSRYKFYDKNGVREWRYEYKVNDTPMTEAQGKALDSGITKELVDSIETVLGNTSVFARTSCNTASDIQKKEVTIEGVTLIAGTLLGITFTNGNVFGDCLAEEPTYPTLSVNGGTEYPICDSRGNTVGTGAWNDGDYIELRFLGDRFAIMNSDVRQVVDDEYILFADGSKKSIDYYEDGSYTLEDGDKPAFGYVSSSGKVLFINVILNKKLPPNKKIKLTALNANLRSNVQRSSVSSGSLVYGGYIGTSADTAAITGGFNFYSVANDGRSIEYTKGYLYKIRLERTSAWYAGHWNDVNNYTIAGDVIKIGFTISD